MINNRDIEQQAHRLRIYSVASHWKEICSDETLLKHTETLLSWEDEERHRRKMDIYLKKANVKSFDPLANFDWSWPTRIDREQVCQLFTLDFVEEAENIVFIGPNGVGKSMLAKNLIHSAAKRGYLSLFVESGALLDELVSHRHSSSLEKSLARFVKPKVLCIDEIGYLSYNNQHADLLFQLVHRRSQAQNPTIVTTNRVFEEWSSVFPNAASVTALIDRLVERCEIVKIEGPSFRERRFKERQQHKVKMRAKTQKG